MSSRIRDDEQVLFFPGTARRLADDQVEARIESWIYEPERRPGLDWLLARYLDLDLDALPAAERGLFHARTQLFRIDSERGKVLSVQFGAHPPLPLPRSNPHGRSSAALQLPGSVADAALTDGWLDYRLGSSHGSGRSFAGRCRLLPPQGLSLVSDIDDTIKHTQVRDRRAMLLNTFVRPFVAVPGMAAEYRLLAAAGAEFHYVSGSPHHLYPALADFLDQAGFPPGSVHLRTVDISNELFGNSAGTPGHKQAVIETLLRDFPLRRFVLVGDSGERDPEIYGALARAWPGRIDAIHIRQVDAEPAAAERYAAAFEGLPTGLWTLRTAAAGLAAEVAAA